MCTRNVFFLLAALAAMLLSCSKEQKSAKDTPAKEQVTSEQVGGASASDTTVAGRYFTQAEQLAKQAKFDSAIVYFNKAAVLYEAEKNWERYVRCYNKMGEQCWRKGALARALEFLDHALQTGSNKLGGDHPEIAYNHYTRTIVYNFKGELDKAIELGHQALRIRVVALGEQHLDVASSYNSLGLFYRKKGVYDQALPLLEKALAIRLKILEPHHPEVAGSYNNLGNFVSDKGDYEQALVYYEKALPILIANLGEKNPNVAHVYNNIGLIQQAQGDYDQAIIFYQKALSIRSTTLGEQHPDVAASYNNLGIVYDDKGDHDQAIASHNKALSIYLTNFGEKHAETAMAYHNIAANYLGRREFDQALVFYKKALSIRVATLGEQHPDVASTYNGIGEVYVGKKRYDLALDAHEKSLAIKLAVFGDHSKVAKNYMDIGDVHAEKGDFTQAIAFYQRAVDADLLTPSAATLDTNLNFDNALSGGLLLNALVRKADSFVQRYVKQAQKSFHDLETAVSTYQLASRLIDHMRSGYKAEGSKLFLEETATEIYDNAIQAALLLDRTTPADENKNLAFLFAEKSKAGVMLEALSEAKAKQFAGIPDSLLAKEKQLRIDLAFYDKRLNEEQLKRQDADSAKIDLWQDKVFSLKQGYDVLLERFGSEYPDYYNLKYQIKTISVPEVQQQLLDDKTTLVEYFTGEDSIFIFTITKDNFIVKTSAKDSLFEQQIEQLRQGITQQNFDKYTQAAHRLYQILLAPVADKLDGKNLLIIPDGVLSAIPFEALLTKQVASGNLQEYNQLPYLVKEHAISYAYSATLLQQEQSRRNRETKRDYLALAPIFAEGLRVGTRGAEFFAKNFGRDSSQTLTRMREGYLPDTKREVTGILNRFENSYGFFERWFGNKSRVYLEREANETRLKSKDIGDYRFLHFATHGLINEKNPKLSGLLLAQEDTTSKEDGILHLGEIYNLNLNADLVVLSACETGLGQIAKGEGIIGLTRGFLYAGASNLLVSLWQVSDVTTADLMVDFYDRMLQGATRPEALAEAKRRLIRSGSERAKPDYWAPFILLGR